MSRKRHSTSSDDEEYIALAMSEDSVEDESDFAYTETEDTHTRGRPKKDNDLAGFRNPKPIRQTRRKRSMHITTLPKSFGEYAPDDLQHDPCGRECRFVAYDTIKDHVLEPEKYLQPNEKGVLTFIPGFIPGNPDHLSVFGFKKELEKLDIDGLAERTDEDLENYLAEVEAELVRIPKPKKKTCVAIPGFTINLTDSIAIRADIRYFDWKKLGSVMQFDVIMMDPPWKIVVKDVCRGVAINYDQLDTDTIAKMPLPMIQKNGCLFMWVIASQFVNGVGMLHNWGYRLAGYINWVKTSKYGRYRPSHGYYIQHDKETVLVGVKGNLPPETNHAAFQSLVVSERAIRQSEKPSQMYEMVEEMFPGQMYMEIFARPHNLRNGWVSLGIELP